MRKIILSTAAISILGLAACEAPRSARDAELAGGLTGAAVGYLTASALDANDEWTIVATLAGAAIGAQVARNERTNECAYYVGNGYYDVRPCR